MLATQKGRSNPVRISCRRSEKLKSSSLVTGILLTLQSDSSMQLFGREPRYMHHFCATGPAGGNGNGRSWQLQKFCEEFDAGVVGLAISRRRSEGNLADRKSTRLNSSH